MIEFFLGALVLSLLASLWLTVMPGTRKELSDFRASLPVGKWLSEANEALEDELGRGGAMALKAVVVLAAVIAAFLNLFLLAAAALGVALGAIAARKLCQIPSVSEPLKKAGEWVAGIIKK